MMHQWLSENHNIKKFSPFGFVSNLSYYVCLPSELHVVVSVGLYLQLFVGGFMSYLRYLCLFAYNGVQHILCHYFKIHICTRHFGKSFGVNFKRMGGRH
jgi:hypothetical protein